MGWAHVADTPSRSLVAGGLNRSRDITNQLLSTNERTADTNHFEFSCRYLTGGLTPASSGRKFAFMASQHPSKQWCCTFLRLRMNTAQADQTLRAVLTCRQGAQMRAHIPHAAANRKGRPFLIRWIA